MVTARGNKGLNDTSILNNVMETENLKLQVKFNFKLKLSF